MGCHENLIWATIHGIASTDPVSAVYSLSSLIRAGCLLIHVWLAVSEDIIKATADIMVDSGLKKAGYEYLVIDGDAKYLQQHMPHVMPLQVFLMHILC